MQDDFACHLPDILQVSGQDAAKFLQGQLTCDLGMAQSGHGLAYAWCTPAGRVRHSGWLIQADAGFLLLTSGGQASAFAAALKMYVLRDKLSIVTGKQLGLGLGYAESSPDAAQRGKHPAFTLPGVPPRRLLLTAGENSGDANAFCLAGIRAGVCELPKALADRFLPQMLNLDLTGGVSFSKGCFPGQEIIARTKHLGRVKRRLLRFSAAAAPPAPGTALLAGKAKVGEVVVAAASGEACELLAVVSLQGLNAATLRLDSPAGPDLEQQSLPYRIPEIEA